MSLLCLCATIIAHSNGKGKGNGEKLGFLVAIEA